MLSILLAQFLQLCQLLREPLRQLYGRVTPCFINALDEHTQVFQNFIAKFSRFRMATLRQPSGLADNVRQTAKPFPILAILTIAIAHQPTRKLLHHIGNYIPTAPTNHV